MMPDKAVPVLASFNLERTINFYRYFGFERFGIVDDDENMVRLRRGEMELEFSVSDIDYTHPDNRASDAISESRRML